MTVESRTSAEPLGHAVTHALLASSGLEPRQEAPSERCEGVAMPKLERSQWYDLCRDMNWRFKYVTEAELFPEGLSQSHACPRRHGGTGMSLTRSATGSTSIPRRRRTPGCTPSAIARSKLFENLDPGCRAAIIAHYAAIAMPEYLASICEARMGRFGRGRRLAQHGPVQNAGRSPPQSHPVLVSA